MRLLYRTSLVCIVWTLALVIVIFKYNFQWTPIVYHSNLVIAAGKSFKPTYRLGLCISYVNEWSFINYNKVVPATEFEIFTLFEMIFVS